MIKLNNQRSKGKSTKKKYPKGDSQWNSYSGRMNSVEETDESQFNLPAKRKRKKRK